MTTVPITHDVAPGVAAATTSRSPATWWASARPWAAVSIVAMWIAVMFVGIYGSDFVSGSAADRTTIPSVVLVAICAMIGTITVAHAALRGGDGQR